MRRAALQLADRGLAVFPCRPLDKRPATAHGCKDATSDVITIQTWWQENPSYNIGIATGAVSGIFVLDVDGAEAALSRLEAQLGKLPPTVEAITARGRHAATSSPPTVSSSPAPPLVGLPVEMPKACSCGSYGAVIGSSSSPHHHSVTCEACRTWRKWLGAAEAAFLGTIVKKFGALTTPIILRQCSQHESA
jgi:hypothetical protein